MTYLAVGGTRPGELAVSMMGVLQPVWPGARSCWPTEAVPPLPLQRSLGNAHFACLSGL